MARIRTIKPALFSHEILFDLECETHLPIRLAFAGLFTVADREGRFVWRPRTLKKDVLPYDEIDFSRVLDALATRGLIVRYRVDGEDYGYIPTFSKHQVINNREAASDIPSPSNGEEIHVSSTREARVLSMHKGKGREGNMEGNVEGKEDACAAPSPRAPAVNSPAFIRIPTNRFETASEEISITEAQVAEFEELYPAVDVRSHLRTMRGWSISNTDKRKTAKGMMRFINSWLAKEQNRGGNGKRDYGDKGRKSALETKLSATEAAVRALERADDGSSVCDGTDARNDPGTGFGSRGSRDVEGFARASSASHGAGNPGSL